ncbi:MAG: carbohydrate ABC transporter permease, partial [Erysipelotrichaceae bacterium]|nr:carbohydrate ABC transporter permease [Erysipelotrichaceae bacterium]
TENAIVADTDGSDVNVYRPLIKYATIVVSVLPMLVVYPFVQKYFVSGVMIGAVKG